MHDAHVHLDFMTNGEAVALDALDANCILFASTVTPSGYLEARERFGKCHNVALGLGLHPWWVSDESLEAPTNAKATTGSTMGVPRDAEKLVSLLDETNFVGEIGLDFGKRHAHTQKAQADAFSLIARECVLRGGKTLSIHSVHAAREALDTLHDAGAFEACTCIFHWFTGPSDQLKRAVQAGCYFSVGSRMLATGKGREYVKAIPLNRILLETDAPPSQGQAYSFAELQAELESTLQAIAAIKGPEAHEVIRATGDRLLSPAQS